MSKSLLAHYRPHVGANANRTKSHYHRDCRSTISTALYSFQSLCRSLVLAGSCPDIPDEPPKARFFLWRMGRVFGHVCVASGKVVGCPSGCLGGFVSRHLIALGSVASGSIISWTASAEPALGHPTVFLTTRAFYNGDSGPLWDSDLAVFFLSIGRP